MISRCLFRVFNFFQKTNENMLHTSKNKFICLFLEEFTTWQFAFEINWPLVTEFSVLANAFKWQNLPSQQHENWQCFCHNRKRGFSIIPDVWIIFFQVCLSKFHSNSFHRDILSLSVLYSLCNYTHSGTLPEKAETQK